MSETRSAVADVRPGGTLGSGTWTRFREHRIAMVAAAVLFLLALGFAIGPMLLPGSANAIDSSAVNLSPSWTHPLGTDQLGRDMLQRVFVGGRLSLRVALVVAVLTTVLGTVVGAVAGYFGGRTDALVSQAVNLFLIVPPLVVLIVVGRRYGSSPEMVSVLLALLLWPTIARVVRGLFLQFRDQPFVLAARAAGASAGRIMFRHIVPNAIGPIVVHATLLVGTAILLESTLSFLGVGVPPDVPTLGNLVNDHRNAVETRPFLILLPAGTIVLIALSVNFLGDGLRDALDPTSSDGSRR